MLASTWFDLVVGVDLHFEMVPTPAPVPMPFPHPFVGMVFDPGGLVVGTAINAVLAGGVPPTGPVFINSLPATNTGTEVSNRWVLPHFVIPPGTMWTPMPKAPVPKIGLKKLKPPAPPVAPAGDAVLMMGAQTTVLGGSNPVRLGDVAMSCSEPVRLPSSVVLALPKGAPVLIGGPPGVDWSQAAGALLRSKWVAGKLHALVSRVKRVRLRNLLHKSVCFLTGHPVDVATGRVLTEAVDWELPGPIPLKFERNYSSAWAGRDSVLGRGWSHSLDLAVWEEPGKVVYRAEDGREIEFDTFDLAEHRLGAGEEAYEPINRLALRCLGEGAWEVETAEGLVHRFSPVKGSPQGVSRVVRTSNRAGHSIHYEYGAGGNLEWVVDSTGRRIQLVYDGKGRLVRVALPHPRESRWETSTRYECSLRGDLVAAYDGLGHAMRYEYEGHLLVKETDRKGVSFYFGYDGQGPGAWCVRTWGDGGMYDHELVYDKKNRVTVVTDSLGHTRAYWANEVGAVVKVVDEAGGQTSYGYDEALRVVAETDPVGNVTRQGYDSRGNMTRWEGPDGAVWELSYNRFNLPERMRDPLGGAWAWGYDEAGQVVEESNPLGERQQYQYAGGLLVAWVDAQGRRTELGYDEDKNVAWVKAPGGETVRMGHDRLGRAVYWRDARGAEWRRQYNTLGWEIRQEEPTGEVWERKWDAEGNLVEVRGPLTRVRYTYTGYHWLATREEAGARVGLRHDTEGRLVEVVNEAGERYRWVLDGCGRRLVETGFDGATKYFRYDLAGRLLRVLYASGRTADAVYDAAGRLTEVRFSDGSFVRYRYRLDGAMVEAENESGKVVLERDALGRLVKEEQKWGWVASRYEPGGGRIGVESSLGARQSIGRDALGRVCSVSYSSTRDPRPWEVWFERDGEGLETERRLPGGVVSRWEYDAAYRPLAQRTEVDGVRQVSRTYHWRGEGQIAAIRDSQRGEVDYEHDARGRLVGARWPDGTYQHRAMDEVGNIYRKPDRSDRKYGPGGRLLKMEGVDFKYDADGNLIEKQDAQGGRWRYKWQGSGLLQEVERPDGTKVAFGYDALARRTCKRVSGLAGPEQEVHFLWDRHWVLHVMSPAWKTDTWIFESGTFCPLAKENSTGRYGVVADQLGSPTEMYDELGQIVWRMQLDVFGTGKEELTLQYSSWRWPGQFHDEEVELYYNRFRYYSPGIGAYVSQDPVGLQGALDIYGYVPDPLTWYDPFGLAKKPRGLWQLTDEMSDVKKKMGGHVYYRHKTTGYWWSRDAAGHGGSAFKVFEEGHGGALEWFRDADEYGDFIDPQKKHKGPKGKKVTC